MPLVGLVGRTKLALRLARAAARRRDRCGLARRAARRKTPAASVRRAARAALARPDVARWLASELLANTAWAGTLVFAGALFTESYDASTALTGCLLAVAAAAYVAGNLACRRLVRREPRAVLVVFASSLALVDGLFGIARMDVLGSAALLAGAAFLAGGRTLVTSAFALSTPPDVRPAITQPPRSDDAVRLLRRLARRRRRARHRRLRRARPGDGARFLGAAAILARRPRAQRTAGARPLLPALYRARG